MPLAEGYIGQRKYSRGSRIIDIESKNRGLANALEKERVTNSKLKNEIVLLKQRDLKYFEDLSVCKGVIASLVNKLSQIQLIATEACSMAEQSVNYKVSVSNEKKDEATHCLVTPQPHTQHHCSPLVQHSIGGLRAKHSTIEKHPSVGTSNPRPLSTPAIKTSTGSHRGQQWKAGAICPARRLHATKQCNQISDISPMARNIASFSSQSNQGGSNETRTVDNATHFSYDFHSPRALYKGNTPGLGSARTTTENVTALRTQLSPNMPAVDEDEAAMCEIEDQIQRLSIGSNTCKDTGARLVTGKRSRTPALPARDDENSFRSKVAGRPSSRRGRKDSDSLPPLSDITNIVRQDQLRTRSTAASVCLDGSTARTASRSTGMQVNGLAGVTVVPVEGISKARTTSGRRRSQSSGNVSTTMTNSHLTQHKNTHSKSNGYVSGDEGIALRKSSRQCVSKTLSYKEEALNRAVVCELTETLRVRSTRGASKKRREDTFGTDHFFIDAWRSKLNSTKAKPNKK